VFCLHSLTCITKCHIFFHITLHSIPTVGCLEILIHLVASWVDEVCRIMSFSEYYILAFLDIGYTNPSFVPEYSLVILSETKLLSFCNIFPDLLEIHVFKLTFMNIL
jgi:hypothetical protein